MTGALRRTWRPGGWPVGRRRSVADVATAWLVVGLGNPGARYESTRHNVGRGAVLALATGVGAALDQVKHNARFGHATIESRRVCLATPTTYMNESGRAVAPLARFYQVPAQGVLVLCDDLDLPLGKLRIRPGGGDGGHNGLASVIAALGTPAVPRIRIGIGRPPPGWDPADFVLARFAAADLPEVDETLSRAADAVRALLRNGMDAAMNEYN